MDITKHAPRQHEFTLRQLKSHPEHNPFQSIELAYSAAQTCAKGELLRTVMDRIAEAKVRAQADLPPSVRAEVLWVAGATEMMSGESALGVTTLESAIPLWGSATPSSTANWMSQRNRTALGFAYLGLSRIREAKDAFYDAVRQAEKQGDPSGVAGARIGLAIIALREGHPEDAEVHLRRASVLQPPEPLLAEILRLSGDCRRALSHVEQAKEAYFKAREIYNRLGDDISAAVVLKLIGDISVWESAEDARSYYEDAAKLLGRPGNEVNLAAVEHAKGDLSFSESNYESAAAFYGLAHDVYRQHKRYHALCNAKADLLRCSHNSIRNGGRPLIDDVDAFVMESKQLVKDTKNSYAFEVLKDLGYLDPKEKINGQKQDEASSEHD
jgi:tetratricopeptide (TPR) repeat protein